MSLSEAEIKRSQEENTKLLAMLAKSKERDMERRSRRSETSSVMSDRQPMSISSQKDTNSGRTSAEVPGRLTAAALARRDSQASTSSIKERDDELRSEIARLKERLVRAQTAVAAPPSPLPPPILPSRQSRSVVHESPAAHQGDRPGITLLHAELRKLRDEVRDKEKKIEELEGRNCQCGSCAVQ